MTNLNLKTRKIVLGLLMTLVLAFSVQGITDALTLDKPTADSGDLQTVAVNTSFEIQFTVALADPANIADGSGNQVAQDGRTRIDAAGRKIAVVGTTVYRLSAAAQRISGYRAPVDLETGTYKRASGRYVAASGTNVVDSAGRAVFTDTGLTTQATAEADAPIAEELQQHNNEQRIRGTLSSGLDWTSISDGTSTAPDISDPTFTLMADTYTLTVNPTTIGEKTITITDITPAADFSPSVSRAPPLTYTIYVVRLNQAIPKNATIRLAGVTNGIGHGYYDQSDQRIYNGDGSHYPVRYTVTGGGLVYVKEGDRSGPAAAILNTSSGAPVYLDVGGVTNTVTASVDTAIDSSQGIYIFGRPEIDVDETVTGTHASGTLLTGNTALEAEIMDSAGTPKGVAGVPVMFEVADKGATGGTLFPTSGTLIVDNRNMVIQNPTSGNILYVRTTTGGTATVDFRVGNGGGEQVITAKALGLTKTIKVATTVSAATRRLSIPSNGNQRRSGTNIFDLTALVENGGQPEQDVLVRFTATRGILTDTPSGRTGITVGGTPMDDDNVETGKDVEEITDSDGIAKVIYNTGDSSTGAEVVASISVIEGGRVIDLQEVIFNIRGGTGTGTGTGTPATRGSLNIAVSPSTGTTRTVTVTASRGGTAAQGISILLNVNNGATLSRTSGPTPLESTLTLPATAGDYVLTATTTADYTGDSETITVTDTLPGSLSITVTGTGATRSVTVTAASAQNRNVIGLDVTLRGTALPGGQQTVRSGTATTITLPTAAGNYTLEAAADGFATVTETITVTAGAPPRVPGRSQGGTLTVSKDGAQVGTQQPILVRATPAPSRNLAFTVTNGGVSVGVGVILTTGTGQTAVTVPTTGLYFLTVSADGYTPAQSRFTAGAQPTGPTTDDAPEPSRIEISGSATYSGNTLNTALEDPLRVRVLDADDDPVADARVVFRVRTGQGRLSQRGNGRAIAVQTDARGYARTEYTPMSASSTLSASVNGVSEGVTFTITTGSAPAATDTDARQYNVGDKIPISLQETLRFTGSRTVNGTTYTCVGPGECVISYGLVTKGEIQVAAVPKVQPKVYKTGDKIPVSLQDTLSFTGSRTVNGTTYTCVGPGECVISYGLVTKGEIRVPAAKTTPPRVISPVVLVNAANRPPMLWVDSGGIYALVGVSVQRFAPSVDNALNIAIGGNKIYWTEQTGESSGTINSANLDGTGMKELTAIMAVPMGIAVDTAGSKLYWTNSRGRIQSANLDGDPKITNVLQNLSGPMDIAVARGNLYWTQYDATEGAGNIGITNTAGRGMPKYISTGLDMPMSLAIANAKVYWTEKTGESGGTVNAATLNGAGATQLASIQAAPIGIAVDGARSKLYWTNSRGRVQSANLDGSEIRNVVDGLGSPGEIVLSNSIAAPAETTAKQTPVSGKSKYDVNGDGTVDGKDSDALIVAVAAGITDAKYDVNGDGKVDINDVVAVNANRSAGETAGAPTLLGMKLNAVERDRLQEQIELLIATNDRSPAALRTLVYLQQLLVMARPEKTQLLANYPNPFNPETWIPYELATDTDVRITIYASNGVVVRRLTLGHQTAGYYTDRERAAYWDGRNASGEQVASGIYFYQLETDDMSSLRKMVILK